jgi:cellulase/cellobiase CelA1
MEIGSLESGRMDAGNQLGEWKRMKKIAFGIVLLILVGALAAPKLIGDRAHEQYLKVSRSTLRGHPGSASSKEAMSSPGSLPRPLR